MFELNLGLNELRALRSVLLALQSIAETEHFDIPNVPLVNDVWVNISPLLFDLEIIAVGKEHRLMLIDKAKATALLIHVTDRLEKEALLLNLNKKQVELSKISCIALSCSILASIKPIIEFGELLLRLLFPLNP